MGNATTARTLSPTFVDLLLIGLNSVSGTTVPGSTVIVCATAVEEDPVSEGAYGACASAAIAVCSTSKQQINNAASARNCIQAAFQIQVVLPFMAGLCPEFWSSSEMELGSALPSLPPEIGRATS